MVLAQGLTSPGPIVADDNDVYVYFADAIGLWKVPADGSAPATQMATHSGGFTNLTRTTNGANLVMTHQNGGTVTACPLPSGSPITIATGQQRPQHITSNGATAFWVNAGNQTIAKAPVSGSGTVTTMYSGGQSLRDITIAGSTLYWTDGMAGTVNSMPLAGGPATVLASGQNDPYGIVVTATTVYWTNYGNGAIGNVAKTPVGGGPITVIPNSISPSPLSLAKDLACVYWLDNGNAQVRSAPR